MTRNILLGGGAVAATAVLVWFLLPAPEPGGAPRDEPGVGVAARRATDARGSGTPMTPGRAASPVGIAPAGTAPDSPNDGPSPPGSASASLRLAALPLEDEPMARVNGVALTVARVFPPGVMQPGDQLPRDTLEKFLDEAVNRALLVQEAERRGYADDPEFSALQEELARDIDGLPNLSPEERTWQVNELREMALADRVFREEGILPRRLGAAEIDAYYRAHSAEYDWVRRREEQRGSSSEKIERRVKEEIRKDLQAPIAREMQQRRDAFTEALRRGARVEILR